MDLDSIKKVVDNQLFDENQKTQMILHILSKDENAIPYILDILNYERKSKKSLITDMNVELSRADAFIEMSADIRAKGKVISGFNKKFVLDNILEFYRKYRNQITCIFDKNLDEPSQSNEQK